MKTIRYFGIRIQLDGGWYTVLDQLGKNAGQYGTLAAAKAAVKRDVLKWKPHCTGVK